MIYEKKFLNYYKIRMDRCLLFGPQGDLSRSKIIPQLKKHGVSYVPIYRSKKERLSHMNREHSYVAYMSLPMGEIIDAIEPYAFDFMRMRPTFLLNLYDDSREEFVELCDYLDFFGHDYVFSAPRVFMNEIINIDGYGIDFKYVNFVNVSIGEEKMYNVIPVFAHILTRVYPNDSMTYIIEELSKSEFVVDTNDARGSRMFTKYKNTNLACEFLPDANEHAVYIQTSSRMHKIYIHSDGYDGMFDSIVEGDYDRALTRHQAKCLYI